jgi:hypothetical protein
MDAEKLMEEVMDLVRDEIINDFVREMLANLRDQPEENREWADGVREWIVDDIWGDPGPSDS